jgi:hypothetical protein
MSKKKRKYQIILFCNKERKKLFYKTINITAIRDLWYELKTEKKPRFLKEYGGKRNQKLEFELGLIYPDNRWAKTKTVTKRDDFGRLIDVGVDMKGYRLKEMIPYWVEEKVYDHDNKKHIRYHELLEIFEEVSEIAQVFTLNTKLFLQIEDKVRMFGNKNLSDSDRLFDLLREDLLNSKKGNFIFVKDITTQQRKTLYNLLEKKGYKRTELFRHYSY